MDDGCMERPEIFLVPGDGTGQIGLVTEID